MAFDIAAAEECVKKYRGCGAPAQALLGDAVEEVVRLRVSLRTEREENKWFYIACAVPYLAQTEEEFQAAKAQAAAAYDAATERMVNGE